MAMRTLVTVVMAAALLTPALEAQGPALAASVAIVPMPSSLTMATGAFTLKKSTAIVADTALKPLARQLAGWLNPATGFDLDVRSSAPSSPWIQLKLQGSLASKLGAEGYRLVSTPKSVTISAATQAGVFYGMQTLRQLLPVAIFRAAAVGAPTGTGWTIPAVTIEDSPRFSWRGAHLDTSRHFMPKEFVKKYIDLLALHKLNRFHWHLTDDQGWRLEIKRYPKLTEVASWRAETLVGHEVSDPSKRQFDGQRYGGFYTQEDAREIVAYAAARFITVVPEIEMPGHSQAVVAAYPELGSTSEAAQPRTNWGVSPFLLNADDSTIQFMKDVLGEVIDIFPGAWIHIGGDEAVKTQWKGNPKIQARIEELGLHDEAELQSWFIRQVDSFLTSKGRRLVGWDEILDGGLAKGATVMSWRGLDGAIAAARSGHDAVLTPTSHTYFDYYQSRDTANEPLAIGGFLPLERVYGWEPMPETLEPEFQSHILGVQGQLWTEYLPTPKAVEYNAFPRLTALAEVAWTPTALRTIEDFTRRLATHLERLAVLDVNFRKQP